MNIKIIKTEPEYRQALARLSALMDAEYGSPEGEELELLSFLLEKYEQEHFPIGLPDPIEAIKFRMDQQGLTRKDLEPYIGSQSKVSEVLNRKRPLSLAMIRALHSGLGIPAEVLLQETGKQLPKARYAAGSFPFTEMFRRGYFPFFQGSLIDAKEIAEEILEQFFTPLQSLSANRIFCRSSLPPTSGHTLSEKPGEYTASTEELLSEQALGTIQSPPGLDECALMAWQVRVLNLASEQKLTHFHPDKITPELIRDVVKLSCLSSGPIQAQERLKQRGIPLVILPHLPHTYLDGACFKDSSGRPIIGMTLRHDRLDNFWFTLVHELAHIYLHLGNNELAFFDDTENGVHQSCNPQEIEANQLTVDLLIPNGIWNQNKEDLLSTNRESRIIAFADQLGISPAVVAGRIRWESRDYTRFAALVGSKTVQKLFLSDN